MNDAYGRKHTMKQLKQTIQNIVILGDSYSTFEGYIPEK